MTPLLDSIVRIPDQTCWNATSNLKFAPYASVRDAISSVLMAVKWWRHEQ